jgi:hypothetical protein
MIAKAILNPTRICNLLLRQRPGSKDRKDWKTKAVHVINDRAPYCLQPLARRTLNRF